jgi:hypothetical protein
LPENQLSCPTIRWTSSLESVMIRRTFSH